MHWSHPSVWRRSILCRKSCALPTERQSGGLRIHSDGSASRPRRTRFVRLIATETRSSITRTICREACCRLWASNPSNTPTLAQYEALYRQPWIDTNAFLFDAPANYMPSYGQHVAFADSYAALLLMLNFPADQKVNLTNYFVQYGDRSLRLCPDRLWWPAFGGHRSGRKLPIILAGILLSDSGMENVSTTYPDQFGEDMQTLVCQSVAARWNLPASMAGRHGHLWRALRRARRRLITGQSQGSMGPTSNCSRRTGPS